MGDRIDRERLQENFNAHKNWDVATPMNEIHHFHSPARPQNDVLSECTQLRNRNVARHVCDRVGAREASAGVKAQRAVGPCAARSPGSLRKPWRSAAAGAPLQEVEALRQKFERSSKKEAARPDPKELKRNAAESQNGSKSEKDECNFE